MGKMLPEEYENSRLNKQPRPEGRDKGIARPALCTRHKGDLWCQANDQFASPPVSSVRQRRSIHEPARTPVAASSSSNA